MSKNAKNCTENPNNIGFSAPSAPTAAAPRHIIERPPLPGEDPTRAQIVLEGECFHDALEKLHAENIVERLLTRLDKEKLPLTDPLQELIHLYALGKIHAQRATKATLAREDGRPVPAAMFSSATRALKQHLELLNTFEAAFDRHKALHGSIEREFDELSEEEQKAIHQKEMDDDMNDMRIPIHGFPLHEHPLRMQTIANCLDEIDKVNQQAMDRGKPVPFKLPTIPSSLASTIPPSLHPTPSPTNPPAPADQPEPAAPAAPSAPSAPSDPSDPSDKSDSSDPSIPSISTIPSISPAPSTQPTATPATSSPRPLPKTPGTTPWPNLPPFKFRVPRS